MEGYDLSTIIFGGSFDPVHLGHFAMAKAALSVIPEATLLWMPAACSPFKTNQKMASERHRYEMCKLMAQEDSRMVVSDLEFSMTKPSYTIDTVKRLLQDKQDVYYFLCGADAFLSLFQWKDAKTLMKLVRFLVVSRKEVTNKELLQQKIEVEKNGGTVLFVPMEQHPISSTELRKMPVDGMQQNKFLSAKVIRYIQENNLYRE